MVSGVSDSTSAYYTAQTSTTSTDELTEDEQSTLDEILSNYDVSNMTDDDFQSLMDAIDEAGITGEGVKSYLEDAGVTAPDEPTDAPPAPPEGEDEESNEVKDLLDQLDAGEITQEEFDSLMEELKNSDETSAQGNLVDEKV